MESSQMNVFDYMPSACWLIIPSSKPERPKAKRDSITLCEMDN